MPNLLGLVGVGRASLGDPIVASEHHTTSVCHSLLNLDRLSPPLSTRSPPLRRHLSFLFLGCSLA